MKYFVYIKTPHGGATPQIWWDDKTTGTNKFQHGEVKNFHEANVGDLVFFHELTADDLEAWACEKLSGEFTSNLQFFQNRYPISFSTEEPPVREQDLFPEGEG